MKQYTALAMLLSLTFFIALLLGITLVSFACQYNEFYFQAFAVTREIK